MKKNFKECLLLITSILFLFFILINKENIAIMYLFPLSIIILSLYLLTSTDKNKYQINLKEFLINLIEGVTLLIFVGLTLIFPLETISKFIIFLGVFLIIESIFYFIKYYKNIKKEIFSIISFIGGILLIIFNNGIYEYLFYIILIIFIISVVLLIIRVKTKNVK